MGYEAFSSDARGYNTVADPTRGLNLRLFQLGCLIALATIGGSTDLHAEAPAEPPRESGEHWAFVRPHRVSLPSVRQIGWVRTPVDLFVLHQLEASGLKPADPASRRTFIRRATLDLTGLPPSPSEVRMFLSDQNADAAGRLVERLLASPRYGERWGRHWLDVARYADSGGFETDLFFGHAWRYRDYVIRAMNADKPYDRFIREQIAGDALDGDHEAILATGLYTTGPVLQEAGMVTGKLEYDQATDAVDTTGSAFLGLTLGCARCHDHKYDPISQKDYFRLQAIFAASDQFDIQRGVRHPSGRAALNSTLEEFEIEQLKERARREINPEAQRETLRRIGSYAVRRNPALSARLKESKRYKTLSEIVRRHARAAEPSPAGAGGSLSGQTATGRDAIDLILLELGKKALEFDGKGSQPDAAHKALATEDERRQFLIEHGKKNLVLAKPPDLVEDEAGFLIGEGAKQIGLEGSEIPVRVLGMRERPLETRLLKRGELDHPGQIVEPGFPSKLDRGEAVARLPAKQWRVALADWIASKQNPLTARVLVNRIWQGHFGEGLVRTPNDFGLKGERPTHPELLDWLAVDFMEEGWSLKRLHRLIMLSSTYQMASAADSEILRRDPGNRLLTRFQPRRLEAEAIWDSLRFVSGMLRTEMFGLPVAPQLDDQEQIGNFLRWPASTPEEANRRGIYLLVRRSFRFPMLSAFDLPDNVASCARRDVTTIPNQALTLMNNRSIREQAGAFASHLLREAGTDPELLVTLAWERAYGRQVTALERQRAVDFLGSNEAFFEGAGDPMRQKVEALCLALFNTNEFIYAE